MNNNNNNNNKQQQHCQLVLLSSTSRSVSSTSTGTTTATTSTSLETPQQQQQQQEQELVPPGISSKIQRTLDPCVVLMKDLIGQYAHDWKDRGGIFSLAQGVVYWKPPPGATRAMKEALLLNDLDDDDENNSNNMSLHLYGPDEGLFSLRMALQEKLSRENGLHNHNVMVTVGANQAYVNCVLTLLDTDGSEASVVFAPYYFNHVMALQMILPTSKEGDKHQHLLVGPSSHQGVLDLDWLEEQFQKQQQQPQQSTPQQSTSAQHDSNESNESSSSANKKTSQRLPRIKVVTIVNPGNPTGTNLDRKVLQRAVDLCRQYHCWLILDCTYEYFVHPKNNNSSNNNDLEDEDRNDNDPRAFKGCFEDEHVLHIFSFSKSYALAGYRCGYVVMSKDAPHDVYNQMLKVQDTIPIAPSRIAQVAALGAMTKATTITMGDGGREWVWEKVATLGTGRNAILQALQPLQAVTGTPIMGGSGAMYVMAQLPKGKHEDDQQVCRALVRDYGIAVIPGSFCGFPGWIRVCYSNLPPQKCIEAAKRLENGIRALIDDET
jgi:aromatic aminotransferase